MSLPAGLYGRQSHGSTKSVDEQNAECEADAHEIGACVVARYSDLVGASRHSRKARDDWPRVLADIDSGKIKMLILWEPSRGDRTLTSWSAMLDLCRERGCLIRVYTHRRTYDPRVARDWRSLADDGVDSAYESEKTSDRNRRTAAAQATAGRPHGPVRYGYERVYDPAKGALMGERIHAERAAVVRDIVKRVGRSKPISEIVRDLNERGVPAPDGGRWYASRVRFIARSPAYAGWRMHKGERHRAAWPAIVTQAQHLAALRVLGDPERKTTRPGRRVWPLSYLARCAECGAGLTHRAGRVYRGRRYRDVYACPAGHTSINARELDGLVLDVLARWLKDLRPVSDDSAAVAARAEADGLRLRLDEWRASAARGETTPATMAHVEAELSGQIREADRRAERAGTPAVLLDVIDGPGTLRQRLGELPAAAQREIIGSVMTIRIARAARRIAPDELIDLDRVLIERKRRA